MVFESVVVDVLNRFLGDYVVNLDTSQLKLGIWGGDAVLRNLEIKENALSQLDIPFKVRAGHIGRLELKIPWKNLYTQSVEATLDGVYLLIVPTASIKYDAEKEEKQLQEARQRELQRIEETKQKAAEQENPALEKQDTFVEKLVTQVIKNLQVKISNIHIRYEDDVTNPKCPLSFGMSLQNLSLQTADENWKPCLLNEKAKLFFKLVQLDNLFAYWNVNSTLYSNHMPDEALRCLQNSMDIYSSTPMKHDFIFRPITANAKLSMNPRSDVNFSSPKVDLVVNLREVAVELNRPQYISILELLGSVDMMSRNLPYRKYRPQFHVHTNAYIWWQYVITGIMEVDVKPRLHMWSWQRIHHHRHTVKRYRALYKSKITNKKPTEKLLREVEETERTLDIFNITLARQQAEMEASKAGLRIFRPGVKVEEESQGWLGWMWSGWSGDDGAKSKEVKTGAFGELMTPAEKAKLYTAIGYSEVAVNHNLPKNFEDIKIHFHMKRMSFSMKDNKDQNEILKVTVEDLKSMLTQRPGAQAIKLSAKLSLFEVKGLANNRPAPTLLSSRKAATVTGTPLLDILFETNPLDESADQRLHVESQPLEIIYDAVTVNSMSAFFLPPDDLQLDELTNATLMKLEQFRDRTSTGLMYVIETQKVLDLNVNLMASYVIVPQTGFYDSTQNLMLLDLGHFKVSSLSRKGLPQLSVGRRTIQDIMSQAYDSFNIKLSSLQFLYSEPDGDWRKARKMKQSALHILEPVDVKVVFSRAMVVTDSRMPKFKIFGEMPLLSLRISDDKVRAVLELINSIPLPESRPAPRRPNTHSTPKAAKQSYTPQLTPRQPTMAELRNSLIWESGSEEDLFYDAPSSPIGDSPFFPNNMPSPLQRSDSVKRRGLVKKDPKKNMTEFLMMFEINKLSVQLCRLARGQEVTVLHLDVERLGTELKIRTFDMTSNTFLHEICLECSEYMDSEEKKVHLITTLDNTEEDLLTLEYTKADKNGPEFKSQYKNTEQSVTVNFSSLDVHLHTEALLNAMNFLNSLLPPTKEAVPSKEELPTIPEEDEGEGEEGEKEESAVAKRTSSKKSKFEDVVNLHIRADLNCLKVFIRGQSHMIAEIRIEGLVSEVLMRRKAVEVLANLKNIVILDCDKEALYKQCVSIADKEVFAFRMVNHTDATEGDAYLDMGKVDTSISLTVGCIQVIFLNKFVSSILAFINNFQAAKEALAEVTVQAAEKAATGVMELAERSTRISLDVDFKAPLVFLPQSSSSTNVTVADLGMVTVKNCFALVDSQTHVKIPPIIDTMTVGLSDLKMYRTTFEKGRFQGEIQVLKPVNLDLSIQRNLSASWYHSIPDIKITAHLKPMNLILSQDDMTVVLRTLGENMSETSDAASPRPPPSTVDRSDTATTKGSQGTGGNIVVTAAVVETQTSTKLKNTLKVDFKFDSMTLVLYSPNGTEVQVLDSRDDQLMLAEFTLGTISTSVHMFSDGSMKASVKLTDCLLDDKRRRVKNITARMMAIRPSAERNVMVEVNYNQGREGTSLETVVQDVYLCASMEFLLTVADIFLKASQQGFSSAAPKNSSTKPTVTATAASKEPAPVAVKSEMNVLVKNPEIVFVADLTRADAPALVMTMECELVMKSNPDGQLMTAVVKDLKVVACPFLREKRRNKETTVLQPCQVFFKSTQSSTSPQAMEVSIKALTLKVSPIIINTVITIQSVLSPAGADMPQSELESPVPPDLWERRSWQDLKLWFLEEEGKDEDAQSLVRLIPQGESLQVAISSICLTLEAGVGHRTVPMLLAKSSFHGDVKNWSTLINLHSQLNLEVHYFNEVMGVWEPLLEPLEDEIRDSFRSWTLGLKMKKKPVKYSGISDEVDCSIPDYKTIISISSKDQLNITLSKCGLGMLSNLGTAFAEAAKQTSECFQEDEAPFVVKNHLGLTVSVVYSDMFCPLGREATENRVELQNGESVNMDYRRTTTHSDQFSAMTSLVAKDYYIQPTPVGHTSASVIPLIKVGRGMYSVMHKVSGVTRFLVCQIYSVQGSKHIKIRSPFQIINHFSIPFRVMEGSTCLGISLPTEEFCVPLDSYRSKLSLQPVTEGDNQYDSSEGFSYESVSQQPGARVQQTCHRHGNSASMLMVNIVPLKDTVTSQHTGVAGEHFDEPYILHLWPSVLLRNLLPYPITYRLQDSEEPAPITLINGHSAELHTAVMDLSSLELHLLNYLGQDWKAHYGLRGDQDEITFIVFRSLRDEEEEVRLGEGGERKRAELDIAVHVKYDAGLTEVAIHSPYWMVNKTGRLLQYKANDIHRKHAMDYDMPLLFSFKPRNFLHNNKVRLMISDSELSDDFSLDTVGSYGEVKCKGRLKDYLIGVKIDPSSFSLTRIVSFVPYYLLVNRTKHVIWVGEEGQDHWTKARPHQAAIPFWPEKDSKMLKIKVEGCLSTPQTMDFTKPENCLLLHLDNTLGGVIVDVNLSDHSIIICFSDYHDGAAPFLIINHTQEQTLEFYQRLRRDSSKCVTDELLELSFSLEETQRSSQKEKDKLSPGKAVYYTWAEPTGSRSLAWQCGSYSGELKSEEDLRLDVNEEGKLYLISFYEGLQRVALFTEDRRIYKLLCESEKAELAEQEIILSLQDVGISLVNNSSHQEVSFIGITSSDVVWEFKPKKKSRWKPLSLKYAAQLETHFREYTESESVDNTILDLESNFQVSLTPNRQDMRMMKPYDAPIRRNFLPGVKVEYSVSARQSAYRVQINRIQIQNQLPGAIFPYVFYPIKLPKSVTMDSEPKPLTDISIVTRAAGHSDISRIKYFMVLIQEMDLKLDLGFLYAILDLFTPETASVMTSEQMVELFEKDIEYLKTELNNISAADTSPISLYEYFHISPIKLHLSLSLSSGGEDGNKEKRETEVIPVQSLNLLLKSIGATLTDVQDVVFKLAYFQLTFQFRTRQQLQWEVIRHYSKQAIKQMYVLVLGLDVLGNPFGLIRGLSEGVEAFFYEPYQGAIQGPEEFVEGMALGVKALVGGAVGGIAGAASRITGAMAKGVAAMTMDEEYQQKRREAMNKQPSGLREGLTRGGKGLVSGFVSGITGIVTMPIRGAQKEGAAGFFKGVGKGLVGAVARPTGGIIDMASSTFQGIKRAAETSQDVESLRPPRFIHEDGVIRPYKEREGVGSQMLQKIENGQFAKYRYFAHAKVNESDYLMITKSGIFFVTKGTFGQLTCEWQYLFDEFTKKPMIVEGRRLRIEAKERVKSVFHAKEFGKIINFKSPEIAEWVLTKLEDARESLHKY
ncbi:vacuolar protein sorting-associated protein 13A isoform X1 [Salmo salar]|uniref:Vacuolar protein sorting-associated protein 13A isoform X1 n=1 Tax=Salmo salar TaxID=8030 RepID=A0A1S3PJV1_SALSA|nr:vacuolar protein sorting-associated protein 13A isoform X1 [Salmo salar]|eukprot:XP_014027654.1 PREDICTED: vacuolar protein sorting-associated protein 13A isoform X1 [Salmo salar]